MAGTDDFVETPDQVWVAETELRPGAVGLAGAIMQNVTHIAPAIAAFLFTTTIVGNAGGRAPLAYLLGFIIVLGLGMCLVQLAKHFPSAGGYFTYVSRTIGPRSGWLTGWMFALYSPIVAGPILAFLGFIFEGEFQSNWQWTWFHWWMMVIVFLPIITLIGYAGISLSVRSIVIVGGLEFLIVLALGLWGLFDPGPGGFTFSVFSPSYNPGHIVAGSGFLLAVVFTVQGLTGWEAAVPLAEETENPRRNVPIATMASIAIVGIMLIIVFWGQVVGWGTADLTKLPSSEEIPALTIAHRVWGSLWWLALLAMFTSVIGASLACQNVATRMWFGMGRAGALPSAFAKVHPTRKTPTNAITAQFIVSLVLGLAIPQWIGPFNSFILTVGYMLVIGVIFVYVIANVGVIWYFWHKRRDEFNWFWHLIVPVATSIVLLYSLDKSFNPLPAYPGNWAPWLVIAWFLGGVAILLVLKARGGEDWLQKAGQITAERPETVAEAAHRPGALGA